jgi:HK97 family phage major capsid protein
VSNIEQLRQQVSQTWARMQEIQERGDREGWTAEDRANWDQANAEIDVQMGDLQRAERMAHLDGVDRRQHVPAHSDPSEEVRGGDPEEYREAFSAFLREGQGSDAALTPRQRELLAANRVEARALGQGTPQAGGFLVPPEYRDRMVEVMKSFGGMLQHTNQIVTATGATMSWPMSDDTANEGIEIAENTQVPEQDLTFDTREIGAHIYTSKMVRVPWSLLQDTAFDLDGFLIRKFGERLGRIYARRLLTGSGSGQPLGLLHPSRIGATTDPLIVGATTDVGATASVSYDHFIDLEHSIDPAYRNGNRTRYMLSDGTLKMARKLKDGEGRPLWVPIPVPGFAPTINGYPYFVDNTLADPAPGGIGAVFGDFFAGMLVRIVQGFQAVRLGERYADFMQTGYFAYSRMDAAPDDPRALAALRFGPESGG